MGSRQNLAWTYYLTLGTSLRKNFSFFSKSKMAAGGQKICDALYLWFTDKKAPRTNRPLYVRLMGSRQNCMDILLDPRNNPAEEFFIFLKIQDGRSRHYGKLRNRS